MVLFKSIPNYMSENRHIVMNELKCYQSKYIHIFRPINIAYRLRWRQIECWSSFPGIIDFVGDRRIRWSFAVLAAPWPAWNEAMTRSLQPVSTSRWTNP